MRIVIAGGGTAGHIFPALATAHKLVSAYDAQVEFIGTEKGLEANLVPAAGFAFASVRAVPFRRKVSLDLVRAPFALAKAARVCRSLIAGADAVVGMGGYVSAPAVAAALRGNVPVILHEQNAVPGLANRWFAKKATTVALSFEAARDRLPKKVNAVVTGNPVRESVAMLRRDRDEVRAEALEVLGLANDRRTVVIFGGSQGAAHVNAVAIAVCRLLRARSDLQFLLLSGASHEEDVRHQVAGIGLEGTELIVRELGFLDRMEFAYAVADLVVSRSGATTLAEITAAGLPAVLVPYPHATAHHQEANARIVQHAGAATVLLDTDLTASALADAVTALTDDDARRRQMAGASEAWGRPDAAGALATVVAEGAGGGSHRGGPAL